MAATVIARDKVESSTPGWRPDARSTTMLRQRIGALILARCAVGAMPPQPPTLRGRTGAVLVGFVRRVLFWLLPQLDHFHAAVVGMSEDLAGALQSLETRVETGTLENARWQREISGRLERMENTWDQQLLETRRSLPNRVSNMERSVRQAGQSLREIEDRLCEVEFRMKTQDEALPLGWQNPQTRPLSPPWSTTESGWNHPFASQSGRIDAARLQGVVEALKDHAPGAARVLDIGSGEGDWLQVLENAGFDASGVEANPAFAAVGAGKSLRLVAADPFAYLSSVPAGCMAAATALRLAGRLSLPQLVVLLDEMVRIVRPGGVALLAVPSDSPALAQVLGRLAELRGFGGVDVICLPPGVDATAAAAAGQRWEYLVLAHKAKAAIANQAPS